MLTQNQTIQNGRYTVITGSKENKYGNSYEAFDNEQRKNVLLKEITDIHAASNSSSPVDSIKTEFAQMAERICKFNQSSLLRIISHFSESNNHYLVVELNEGKTLGTLFEKKQNPFTTNDVTNWADQLLDAISFLHSQSPPLFHRDIKPENIQLTSEGTVKLSMLNIIQHSDLKKFTVSEAELFESKNLSYSPLEQIWFGLDSASQNVILNHFDEQSHKILERPADARSDIYSLGATIYYLLTGRMPFDSLSRLIDILDGGSDPLLAPHKINSRIPEEVSAVILKSLEIKREDRFNSAAIMRQVLRTALSNIKDKVATTDTVVTIENLPVAVSTNTGPESAIAKPFVQTPKQAAKAMAGEEKSQLDIIKKQLLQAEEKRLIAEKRATEAERLLLAQKEANDNTDGIPAFEMPIPIAKVEQDSVVLETEPALVKSEEPLSLDADDLISTPVAALSEMEETKHISESDVELNYFDDLYDKSDEENKKSYFKLVAAVLLLLLVGGGAYATWSFYGKNLLQPEQIVSSQEKVPPVPLSDKTPAPTPDLAKDASITDLETDPNGDGEIQSTESVVPRATAEPAAPTQNNPTRQTRTTRPPKQIRQTARSKIKPKVDKPAPTQKPTKPPKKSVTLDDLLKDN